MKKALYIFGLLVLLVCSFTATLYFMDVADANKAKKLTLYNKLIVDKNSTVVESTGWLFDEITEVTIINNGKVYKFTFQN